MSLFERGVLEYIRGGRGWRGRKLPDQFYGSIGTDALTFYMLAQHTE
jgi:hypothetical protein